MYVVSDQGKMLARYDERTGVPLGQRRIGNPMRRRFSPIGISRSNAGLDPVNPAPAARRIG
jgi:hypothetical protein